MQRLHCDCNKLVVNTFMNLRCMLFGEMCGQILQSPFCFGSLPRLQFGNRTYTRTAHVSTTNAPLIGSFVLQQTAGCEWLQSVNCLSGFFVFFCSQSGAFPLLQVIFCFTLHWTLLWTICYISVLLQICRSTHFLYYVFSWAVARILQIPKTTPQWNCGQATTTRPWYFHIIF